MTGSCYEPPPLDHHNLMDSQSHRHSGVAASHPYGYAAAYNIPGHVGGGSMETAAGNMSMYQQTLWQNSHHALLDDKRGSVIMGQPPPPAPPAKRKGGRKPKDDPVS